MENEAREEKDLALSKKELFEKKVLEEIENLKDTECKEFIANTNKKNLIPIDITIIKDGDVVYINVFDKEIVRYENGKFIYNLEYIKQLSKSNSIDLDSLGLPDLEELEKTKDINKKENTNENEEQKDEEEKDVEDLNKEEEEEEEKKDEELIDEIAEEEGLDEEQKGNIIELRRNRKITEKHKLPGLIPELSKYERTYIVPDKDDEYSYKIIGLTSEGKREEVTVLEQTEGDNPMQKIVSIDPKSSNNMIEGTAVAMYKRNNKEGIAIKRGPYNQKEVTYYRRMEVPMPEGGTKEMYVTIPLPQQNTRNTDPKTTESAKTLMDKQKTSEDELEESMERYFILKKLDKQDVPKEIDPTEDGIQVEEITPDKFNKIREQMIIGVTKELNDENQGHPDNRKNMAIKIVKSVLDDGMDYNDAKDEVLGRKKDNDEREEDMHSHKLGGISF